MTTTHRLAVLPDPFLSLIGVASANNFIPTTLFGIVQHVKTASTAKDVITLTTTALTPIPSASLNQSALSLLPITTVSPRQHVGAQLQYSMQDSMWMTGDTMVRITLMMTMTGRPNVCND